MTEAARRSTPPTLPRPITQSHSNQNVETDIRRRVFKTVLITDSILRHVGSMDTANALGTNHKLELINKRDSSGLNDNRLRSDVVNKKPDYIYVHLGVNDVQQQVSTKDSLINFYSFMLFINENLPQTKLFLSLPLFTGDTEANHEIADLRDILRMYVSSTEDNRPLKDRNVFINSNTNFMRNGRLVPELYGPDVVHLTETGKGLILANMRHSIHEMTRIILNKPRRAERQSNERRSRVSTL